MNTKKNMNTDYLERMIKTLKIKKNLLIKFYLQLFKYGTGKFFCYYNLSKRWINYEGSKRIRIAYIIPIPKEKLISMTRKL